MTVHSLTKHLPVAVLLVLSPVMIGFLAWTFWLTPKLEELPVVRPNYFTPIELEATAAIVYDPVNNKIIYAKGKDEVMPIASIAKIMTAYLAEKNIPADTKVTTADGRQWRLNNLIDFTLVTSSNAGAESLAAAVLSSGNAPVKNFSELMNEEAKNLGLFKTVFNNPTGLDENNIPSARSTAFDIARLIATVITDQPHLLTATTYSTITIPYLDGEVMATNTNTKASTWPGLFASKTGFTKQAGGSLVIGFDAGLNQPLIIVVLGSSETERIRDTEKLARAAVSTLIHDQ